MHLTTPQGHAPTGRAAREHRPRRTPWIAAATGTLALAGLTLSTLPAAAQGGSVNLVAYSTPKPAYTVLAADFAKTKSGAGVTVTPSFGPSGTQATSVADGLPADLVNFSLEPDIDKLVKAGLVSSSWDSGPTKGMVTDSIVSFVVRPGNPKHITTWADLVKPGVGVVTPNVFSSGSAKWNLLAAYGAETQQGKTPAQAQAYLAKLLQQRGGPAGQRRARHCRPSSRARATCCSTTRTTRSYAKKQGEAVQVVTPPQTILIQNPIAVTKSASPAAKAFLTYLLSPAGQTAWGQQGYRPVVPSVAAKFNFPKPKTLFTVNTLGGWTTVNAKFFDPTDGHRRQGRTVTRRLHGERLAGTGGPEVSSRA